MLTDWLYVNLVGCPFSIVIGPTDALALKIGSAVLYTDNRTCPRGENHCKINIACFDFNSWPKKKICRVKTCWCLLAGDKNYIVENKFRVY